PYLVDGDREDPLALRQQVDHRLGRGGLVDPDAVRHQGYPVRGLLHGLEVPDGLADLLERDPRVEELLDHPQLQEVLAGVQTLGAGPPGVADGRADQARAGPVVELPVADPDHTADLGDAIALFLGHDNSVITRT